MGPEQESQPDMGNAPATPGVPARRERRPGRGRGRRGRGRRPPPHREEHPAKEAEGQAPSESVKEPLPVSGPAAPPGNESATIPEPSREGLNAIQKAIEEVNHIIAALRTTLDEMEEVLETLELAERQKDADEQEIESLRRALRSLHRPREQDR